MPQANPLPPLWSGRMTHKERDGSFPSLLPTDKAQVKRSIKLPLHGEVDKP